MSGSAPISVVMAAYNAEATIGQALRSALAQSRPASEIVVVDDGSTDATAELVMSLAAEHPQLSLLRQPNAGQMAARNLAVAASHGAFVAPLDADDLWHPDYLHDLVGALEQGGPAPGFAYAVHRVIDGDGRTLRDFTAYGLQGSTYFRHLLVNFVGNGSSAVFRRDALDEAGGYDALAHAWGGAEDYLLQLRVARRRPVAFVRRALVGYRRTGESYSSDPAAAHRARLACIRQAMTEGPDIPLPIQAWVAAEAARVHAISLVARGRWLAGTVLMAKALALDPPASASEILQRLRNAAARAFGPEKLPPNPALFADLDPRRLSESRFDPLMRRRLARVEPFDMARAAELAGGSA